MHTPCPTLTAVAVCVNCLLAGGVAIVGVGMSLGAIIIGLTAFLVKKRRLSQAGGQASKEQKAARKDKSPKHLLPGDDPDAPVEGDDDEEEEEEEGEEEVEGGRAEKGEAGEKEGGLD